MGTMLLGLDIVVPMFSCCLQTSEPRRFPNGVYFCLPIYLSPCITLAFKLSKFSELLMLSSSVSKDLSKLGLSGKR